MPGGCKGASIVYALSLTGGKESLLDQLDPPVPDGCLRNISNLIVMGEADESDLSDDEKEELEQLKAFKVKIQGMGAMQKAYQAMLQNAPKDGKVTAPGAHFSVHEPAYITLGSAIGVKPSQQFHHGELYPYSEGDDNKYYYWFPNTYGVGVTWQFSNNLGTVKRFGKFSPLMAEEVPPVDNLAAINNDLAGKTIDEVQASFGWNKDLIADTEDIYWRPLWWGAASQRKEFKAAKRMIGPTTLAGPNCGWAIHSGGRFMLYYVETLMRYWTRCDHAAASGAEGKKAKASATSENKSYIGPGMRQGSSSIQYFWGGKPYNTYLKRHPLHGPYAFNWETMRHNRDRNGNGFSEGFYSTKANRRFEELYDPPAIFGLYGRQQMDYRPEVKEMRKFRRLGWLKFGNNVNIMGQRFGRRGATRGCGTHRLNCVQERREYKYKSEWNYRNVKCVTTFEQNEPGHCTNIQIGTKAQCEAGGFVWTDSFTSWKTIYDKECAQCQWYEHATDLGPDPMWFWGCNEVQLLRGVCFDPCLSMKYNYGFFPGGKLLSLNSYVRYRDHREDYNQKIATIPLQFTDDRKVTNECAIGQFLFSSTS